MINWRDVWKEVSDTHPNALVLLFAWYEKTYARKLTIDESVDIGTLYYYLSGAYVNLNIRDLFDFFDAEGIYITMSATDFGAKIDAPFRFGWDIRRNSSPIVQDEGRLDSRTEAEQQAFTKAFSILEERLNK